MEGAEEPMAKEMQLDTATCRFIPVFLLDALGPVFLLTALGCPATNTEGTYGIGLPFERYVLYIFCSSIQQ